MDGNGVGRAVWLEQRKQGIGGTDAAAILGLSKFSGALDVWMDKVSMARSPKDTTPAMRWGQLLEEPIAQAYAEATGRVLYEKGDQVLQHPLHPMLIGTPDRLVYGEERGFEAKTASPFAASDWGEPGTDQVPAAYLIQCCHYMAITGFPAWDLGVLIGGSDFRIYTIRRDLELEQMVTSRLVEWWERHVVQGERPPIDGTEAAARYLAARYPVHMENIRAAEPEDEERARRLADVRLAMTAMEDEEALLVNTFKDRIGDVAGILGEGWKATWRTAKGRQVVDWEGIARQLAGELAASDSRTPEQAADAVVAMLADLGQVHMKEGAPVRRFVFNILKGKAS
jgi:putative phage-type endonuclease